MIQFQETQKCTLPFVHDAMFVRVLGNVSIGMEIMPTERAGPHLLRMQ